MPAALEAAATRFCALMPNNGIILDVGCGTGRDTIWFRNHGYQALGVDISDSMLKIAKAKSPTGFFHTDARKLEFPDESFSGIWCAAVLMHIPMRAVPDVFRDFRRLLRAHGIGFVSTKIGSGFSRDSTAYPPETRVMRLYTPRFLNRAVLEAGLKVEDQEVSQGWARLFFRRA